MFKFFVSLEIALNEEWAKDLMYCDMESFAIAEDGSLLLCDECGKFTYCPPNRFRVELDLSVTPRKLYWAQLDNAGLLTFAAYDDGLKEYKIVYLSYNKWIAYYDDKELFPNTNFIKLERIQAECQTHYESNQTDERI